MSDVWFDKDKAWRIAHAGLERQYRSILASVTCPEHRDSPWLVKYGDSMYKTEIEGCCPKVKTLGLNAIRNALWGRPEPSP